MTPRRRFVRVALAGAVMYCLYKWFTGGDSPFSIMEGLVIIAFFAYEIWIGPWRTKRKDTKERRERLAKTFELRMRAWQLPVNVEERQSLEISIAFANQIRIETFNLRFLNKHGDGNFHNADTRLIELLQVTVVEVNMTYEQDQYKDKSDGVTVRLRDNGFQKYPGEEMQLQVRLFARVPWSGWLGFQGFDADGGRQYSQSELTVITAMPPSLTQVQ